MKITKYNGILAIIISFVLFFSLCMPLVDEEGINIRLGEENATTSQLEALKPTLEYVSKTARVSCYTDRGLTASGEYVRPGIVAVSDRNIPMDSQLYLEDFGIMDVRDKTATWVRDKYPVLTIDVWMTEEECQEFGLKYLTYKLL